MNIGEIYDKVREIFIQLIKNPEFYIYLFLFIMFGYLAYYIYNKNYIKSKNNNYKANKEYIKDNTKEINLYFFYTTWCPHSKKSMDVLKDFEKEYKSYKNYKLNYLYIDAEEQENLANEYNVESYPSLYLVKGSDKIYFDANIKEPFLKKFLDSSL